MMRNVLIVLGISKSHKRQVVAGKGFGDGEILFGGVVVVDVVEVARVIIAAEVRNDRRNAISDRVEGPLIVDEEFMTFDLFHADPAQPLSSAFH